MQKSSLVKYSLFVTVLMLVITLVVLPSSFRVFSQNPFTETPLATPLPQMVESDDPLVERTGNWTPQSTAGASGGSYLYSSGSTEDVLTLYFVGTYISVGYVQSSSLGTFAIEVDNTVLRTVITTNDTTVYGTQAVISYLSPGSHTLRVYSQQGVIAIDNFYPRDPNASTPTPVASATSAATLTQTPTATVDTSGWNIYDDRDSRLKYVFGTWTQTTDTGAYNNTLTVSEISRDGLVFYFEGTGVEIIYSGEPDGTMFVTRIDSIPYEPTVTLASATIYGQGASFAGLENKIHRIDIMKSGGKLPIDAVRVNGELVDPPAPSGTLPGQISTTPSEGSAQGGGCDYSPTTGEALVTNLLSLFQDSIIELVVICLDPTYSYQISNGHHYTFPYFDFFQDVYTGLAPIVDNVVINGNGAILHGLASPTDPFGIFAVATGGHLTLNQVTVTGGYAHLGGGIAVYINARLTLNESVITNNTAYGAGGGIYDELGWVHINDSEISYNTTLYSYGRGGGIYSDNSLTIQHSSIHDNTAAVGGGIFTTFAGVTINSSVISNNHANGTLSGSTHYSGGGGIFSTEARLTVTNTDISNNTATLSGSGFATHSINLYGSISITQGCFRSNSGTSLSNPSDLNLNATQNWWGSPEGPTTGGSSGGDGGVHSVEYPEQDSISGNVTYMPYSGSAPGFCPTQITSTATPTPYFTPTTPSQGNVLVPRNVPSNLMTDPNPDPSQERCLLQAQTQTIALYPSPIDAENRTNSFDTLDQFQTVLPLAYWLQKGGGLLFIRIDGGTTLGWIKVDGQQVRWVDYAGIAATNIAKCEGYLVISAPADTYPLPATPTLGPSLTPSPTQTLIPDNNLCVQNFTNQIQSYGVTVQSNGRPWTCPELQEVLIGIETTARALWVLSGLDPDPRTTFMDVIGPITVSRVSNGYALPQSPCNTTNDASCTDTAYHIILFYGDLTINNGWGVSQYTMVHELGHYFNSRSDGKSSTPGRGNTSLYGYLQSRSVSDLASNILLGQTSNDWKRGERGWGTGPAFYYQNNTLQPSGRIITNFQQNSLMSATPSVEEVDEAVADMFLNWIYYKATSGIRGFRNESWIRQSCSKLPITTGDATLVAANGWGAPGCSDIPAMSGDVRLVEMNYIMTLIYLSPLASWNP